MSNDVEKTKIKNKEFIDSLKKEHKVLVEKACVYTNLAYALVEAASSLMVDVDYYMLSKIGASVSNEEKNKFNSTRKQGKIFNMRLEDISKKLYGIKIADEALKDADKIYDLMLLVSDRCGGDTAILDKIKKTIENSFESKLGYYGKK